MVKWGDEHILAISVDLHFGVARNIAGTEFFDRTVRSAFPGALTLSPADHLWFLASRHYSERAFHGKTSLRELAYLSALLRSEVIEWDVVADASTRYALGPSLYYPLVFLGTLLGTSIPDFVLTSCDPSVRIYERDAGPQIHEWFEVESFEVLMNIVGEIHSPSSMGGQ